MSESVLDAIKEGLWDFEPNSVSEDQYNSTHAMPGTSEKVDLLAARIKKGLPLWHSDDRVSYDDTDDGLK